jgi:hypothetical protein
VTEYTLADKLLAVMRVWSSCHIPTAQWGLAELKTCRGHREHNDAATLNVASELRGELADIVGYVGLAAMRGEWSWRLWLVAVLAGLQWRLLGRSDDDGTHTT